MKAKAIYVASCTCIWALYGLITFVLVLGLPGFVGYVVIWAIQGTVAGTATILLLPLIRRLIKQTAMATCLAASIVGAAMGFSLTFLNFNAVIVSNGRPSTDMIHSITLATLKAVFAYSLISVGITVIVSNLTDVADGEKRGPKLI